MKDLATPDKMENQRKDIYPVFQEIIQPHEKEKFLNQRGKVIWLTGLSGSGKTTIGILLEKELFRRKYFTKILDGDNIRSGINNNLTFSVEDRKENIRRIAEVSRLFIDCGVIVISCFISPTREIRDMAKSIIGEDNFLEIFINAPLEVCESRDVKGLYEKARKGEIPEFTGITSPYENPVDADLEIRTDKLSIEESIKEAVDFILPHIELKPKK